MLMIHWHNYEKELISYDMINFLTGKTAAGKSTIIDALQLVLLGDTNGNFFNKAANQKSARTLKSYLFGEIGDDGDSGFRYMRNERFSSYVALEFEDTEKKSKFTTGIVCDCYKDQSFEYKWFMLHNQGFPENLFIDEMTKVPYDIQGLKSYLNRTLGRKKSNLYEFYDTNKRYQEVTLGKFGQIKSKYRTLLRKAVPFSPIADIEQFITESICDVRNNIDVEQMQSDIRQYKNLEDDAKKTQERIIKLKEINKVNESYEREKEKYLQQKYIVDRAEKDEYVEQAQKYSKEIEKKQLSIEKNQIQMDALKEQIEKMKAEVSKLEEEYRVSDIAQKEKDLRNKLDVLNATIKQLENGIQNALQQIKHYGHSWIYQLERAEKAGFVPSKEFKPVMKRMDTLEKHLILDFPFKQTSIEIERLKQELNEYKVELKKRSEQIKSNKEELENTIKNLEKGIKPFPEQVNALKRLLEEKLFERYNKTVEVNILADLLEIQDQRWRNAVEGYLDKQKFYLLVPQEYYHEALRIYDQERRSKTIYDAGLVDIGKLRKTFIKKPLIGSLAEEVETENADARLYANYLLGGVMKCEQVEELNQYKIAITASCMLYKSFVSRKINPIRYATPFIGRKSMELMLSQKRKEFEKQIELYEIAINNHRIICEASNTAVLSEYEAQQHQDAVNQKENLNSLIENLAQVKKEYESLDLMYLERLNLEIQQCKDEQQKKEDRRHDLDKDNVQLQTEIKNLQEKELPKACEQIAEVEKRIDDAFDPNWIIKIAEPRYIEVKSEEREVSLKERFYRAMKQTESQRDKLRKTRTTKRSDYNSIYKMPYDIELESNRYFDKELEELEQIRLPEYLEKIKDSKQKAYNQFRDDFIAKIKSNIESVSKQIDELNDSLRKSVFGTDQYRFVKSPRPEYRNYYNMIMDPLLMDTGGWNIASQSFNEKYQKEIDELFQLLIMNETNVSAERRQEYEKSIRKFTDYKTYLVFDLIVTNEQGEEQRLSRTLLKKSGGETQIPFYIALLASFSQVCRIRNKTQNNTIRVIILDEAFSKMDGERIRESIRLLRRFELQAIFSAPPDKIPDIAPLVDRNIAVYKENKYSFTKHFDPKQIEEPEEE